MLKLKLILIVGCLCFFFTEVDAQTLPNIPAKSALCEITPKALKEASSIRRLSAKHPVKCLEQTKDEVKTFLLSAIDKALPPKKLLAEEFAMKELGFLPMEFPYKDGIVALYLSQLGGYYDPEKKHFVVAGWMPALIQTPIAVHELTHALQDQHYDLTTFVQQDLLSSDQKLARSALIEGDASAVMFDYTFTESGGRPIAEMKDISALLLQSSLGAAQSQVEGYTIPLSLRSLIIFPYTTGLNFAHKLLRSGGYSAIDRAFRRPPRSTEEIIHFEKYLAEAADFVEITTQELLTESESSEMVIEYQDTLGEFIVANTLSQCGSERDASLTAAAGWGGDRLVLLSKKESEQENSETSPLKYRKLIWETNWDSSDDRDQFVLEYLKCVDSQHRIYLRKDRSRGYWQGDDERANFQLEIRKNRVRLTIDYR